MPWQTKREDKGKSLIVFPSDYVVVDLETTGLSPKDDEVIEIACIKVRNNTIIDTFSSLVKPKYEVDDFISELTGITNEMLADSPPIEAVLPKAIEFISDDIVVGQNVNFDVNFLYDVSEHILGVPFINDFVDTMRLSRKLFPEYRHHRLVDMVERLNIQCIQYHRALGDCDATLKCLNALCDEAKSKYDDLNEFYATNHNNKSTPKLDARSITTNTTEFDVSHPLYDKLCVFTGVLEKMQRSQAMQIVVDCGGHCGNTVTTKTNYLILGNNDYCPTIKDGKSSKQKKAESYKLKGYDIEIMPESVFYDMVEQQ